MPNKMTMKKDLKYYIDRFQHLRQAPTKYGPAPHKAVLLLSIIRGIELGFITENKIIASPIMLSLFKTTWGALVTTANTAAFTLPFFHLRSSKFWHFKAKDGFEEWLNQSKAINSLAQLQTAIQYAYLDGELFLLRVLNKTGVICLLTNCILSIKVLMRFLDTTIPRSRIFI